MALGGAQAFKYAIVAASSLAAAWPAYEFALVSSLRVTNPAAALKYHPDDSLALAKVVDQRIKLQRGYAANAEDNRAALRSLVSTPLSRASLRIIGMNAEMRGDAARAASAMELSQRVSRRDSLAQVWLLEKAAEKDDFEGFVQHYHFALSVTPELGSVLQPVLVSAVKYPQVRAAIRPYLQNNDGWTSGFLELAANEASPSDLLEMTLPVARWLSDKRYQAPIARIAYRLAADGRWDDAMKLAEATWGDFDSKEFASRGPDLATTDERLGRLAWSLTRGDGISARVAQDGFLDVSMDPLTRGIVAFREVPVNGGGEYDFTQRIKFSGTGESAHISWFADCVASAEESGRRIWNQVVPARSEPTTYRSTIKVPSDCNLLTLTLFGTGPESQPPSNFSISQIEFSHALK